MKIKNILYVASFMAFAGINAAEERVVLPVVQEGQAVVAIPRTAESVLLELAGAHPAIGFIQRNFFLRAAGNLRVASIYGRHILKYPVTIGAVYLPVSWVFDGYFIKTLFTGAAGAAAFIGLCKGPSDARKQLEDERKVEEHPVLETRLTLAADRIARSENLRGSLDALAGRMADQERQAEQQAAEQRRQFQQQGDTAREIAAAQAAQFQAEIERKQAEEAALRLSIAEQTELAERTSSNLARLRAETLEVANGLESLLQDGLVAQFDKRCADFARIDKWHLEVLAIESNPAGFTAEGLERINAIKRQQGLNAFGQEARALFTRDLSGHIAKLPEIQQRQLMDLVARYSVKIEEYARISASLILRVPALEGRIKQQLSLASGQQESLQLEAAAMATPVGRPASVRSEVESSRPSMAMFNSFGPRALGWHSVPGGKEMRNASTQTTTSAEETLKVEDVD